MKNKRNIILLSIALVFILMILILKHCNPDYSRMNFNELCRCYSNMSENQSRKLIEKTNMETWSVAKIEKFIQLTDNVQLYANELPQDVIRKRINTQLFKFRVNGKVFPADIFFGYEIINQYRLSEGDDTAHILEFPESYQVVTLHDGDQVEIELQKEYATLGNLKFYQVDPWKLIDEGYRNTKELSFENKQLIIEKSQSGREQLIFTIFKGRGEVYYKKLVWVIRYK